MISGLSIENFKSHPKTELRLTCCYKKGFIRHDASTVHFLDRKEHEHATTAHAMDVLPGGKIKSPPAGFFDQFDKDMKTLIGF
jgi:predicted ATPase